MPDLRSRDIPLDDDRFEDIAILVKFTVGKVGKHHNNLYVRREAGKYYWSIEDYDGYEWEEIPETVYRALADFGREKSIRLKEEEGE